MRDVLKRPVILSAEDDPDDRIILQEALEDAGLAQNLYFVRNGEELINYLCWREEFSERIKFPRPALILLDICMPKKDGWDALREIKANPDLRRIPVVMFTTSQQVEDVANSYDLGACGYVTKPARVEDLSSVIQTINDYWFHIVELPPY